MVLAVNLSKGEKISLAKPDGNSLQEFCVGVNWGAIDVKGGFLGMGKKTVEVDLDLSCVLLDSSKNLVDYIYSPLYRTDLLRQYGLEIINEVSPLLLFLHWCDIPDQVPTKGLIPASLQSASQFSSFYCP